MINLLDDEELLGGFREEEALFARDGEDRLIRREKATREQFDTRVTIVVDGVSIVVPRAEPLRDGRGNLRRDSQGNLIPRNTTIYDAIQTLYRETKPEEDVRACLPVLCHQEHLPPVAVCRLCSVHVTLMKDGKPKPGRKLVPACQHLVEDGMVVVTMKGEGRNADDVRSSVKMLTELLIADHMPPPSIITREGTFRNELAEIATTLKVERKRFAEPDEVPARNADRHEKSRPIPLPTRTISGESLISAELPYSSQSFRIDHERCVLCDRCVRACSVVKPFNIISHTGKGYATRISFDLDQTMEASDCVQCGECMTSCPTGAITINRRIAPRFQRADLTDVRKGQHAPEEEIPSNPNEPLPENVLTAQEMQKVRLKFMDKVFRPFAEISFSYLRWNEGAVRRRKLADGEVLCRQGDFGSTAYLLERGNFDVIVEPPMKSHPSWFRRLLGAKPEPVGQPIVIPLEAERDLILGEMACMTSRPRTATVKARGPAQVLEVSRNVLDMMQRTRATRDELDAIYRTRAIQSALRELKLFDGLTAAQRAKADELFRSEEIELLRFEPGERIVQQGEKAVDFYFVRLGFVQVFQRSNGQEQILAVLRPNEYFGEIALLAEHPRVRPHLPPTYDFDNPRRTASCSALDDVEIVRISGYAFRALMVSDPDMADRIAARCEELLLQQRTKPPIAQEHLAEYVRLGLYQGRKILALDLDRCTRCDECTRACADSHGDGISRLIREGLRFGPYLVAGACRSCHKPYCMEGCPVDAIHRHPMTLEMRIDDHCIGCGLCERQCPYGVIQVVPRDGVQEDADPADYAIAKVRLAKKAVNCDLCNGLVPNGADPFCVAACPHEAAFRFSGDEIMDKVMKRLPMVAN